MAEEAGGSSREIIAKTLSLLTAPVMRPLILLFLYSGLSNAYWSGMLPGQVDTAMVGPAMVVVGVAEVCGGLVYGRMIDCVGAKRTLCAVLLQNLCALALSVVANLPAVRDSTSDDLTSEHLFYGASFLLGAADNGLMTCICECRNGAILVHLSYRLRLCLTNRCCLQTRSSPRPSRTRARRRPRPRSGCWSARRRGARRGTAPTTPLRC